VTLTGEVDSSVDRDAIISKVRQVNGVRSVNASGLRVK
jgi:osmotically-inducible protein OsmY